MSAKENLQEVLEDLDEKEKNQKLTWQIVEEAFAGLLLSGDEPGTKVPGSHKRTIQ